MDWREAAQLQLDRMPEGAEAVRQLAHDDLFVFAKLVNPGYMYGDIHKKVFRWLQEYELYGMDNENNNKLVMLPRGHLKSHCMAVWVTWIIMRHPEVTILYLSATAELAELQLYSIKKMMESAEFQRYWPEYIHPQEGLREKWAEKKIIIDHAKRAEEAVRDATVATAGLTTNTTGWHADIIVPDDLVIPENAYTEDGRASVARKSSQFTSIRNAGGLTAACGTRYHPDDIYATWKTQYAPVYDETGEFIGNVKIWEIMEEKVEVNDVFIWPRTMRGDGKAFGFSKNVLARIKAEYIDVTQFYAQYYNDPNDPGSNRMDRLKFQYYDRKFLEQIGGKWTFKGKRLNVYAAIDFAYSMSKQADYTAIVVIGIDADGYIYVLDIDRFKTNKIPTIFAHIKPLHAKWEFKKLRAEISVAQEMIVEDLKDYIREDGMRMSIDPHRPTTTQRKAERIDAALAHKYDNQTIWHFRGGYTDVLEEELVLSRPAHDDVKDSLASAVEIAIKPRGGGRSERVSRANVVSINKRFGGVQF